MTLEGWAIRVRILAWQAAVDLARRHEVDLSVPETAEHWAEALQTVLWERDREITDLLRAAQSADVGHSGLDALVRSLALDAVAQAAPGLLTGISS